MEMSWIGTPEVLNPERIRPKGVASILSSELPMLLRASMKRRMPGWSACRVETTSSR